MRPVSPLSSKLAAPARMESMTHEPSSDPHEGPARFLRYRPDRLLSDAAASGELLVASVRLLVLVILVYLPARLYLAEGFRRTDLRMGLFMAAAALLGALLVYSAVNRHWGVSWIGFASAILDVSLVSALLLWLLQTARVPADAVHDPVVFGGYFLAIAATSLRYDPRVCLITGTVAVAEYLVIVVLAARGSGPGDVPWDSQLARGASLVLATALAASLVVRARDLRTLSARDRFTGLLNRTTFDERLRVAAADAEQAGVPEVAVAMLDIDHFKRFNDTHGHAGGDAALKRVAAVLRRSFRESDAVARYGGEEFSVLLFGVGADRVGPLLERIRREVESSVVPLATDTGASVTVSIGVATRPEDGRSASELLAVADRRLYQAKAAGRNRVVGPEP